MLFPLLLFDAKSFADLGPVIYAMLLQPAEMYVSGAQSRLFTSLQRQPMGSDPERFQHVKHQQLTAASEGSSTPHAADSAVPPFRRGRSRFESGRKWCSPCSPDPKARRQQMNGAPPRPWL